MTSEQRQHQIEEFLREAKFASLEELSEHVGASVSTVRRDLTALAASGHIRRTHGGACLTKSEPDEEPTFFGRNVHQLSEKDAIARACAELVRPGQSVILDAGTTVHRVARWLGNKPVQVITNSLPVANYFAHAQQQVEVVVSGGILYSHYGVLVGPSAAEALSKAHADVAIMSAGGITAEGVTNTHALFVDVQRAMIQAAGKVIFCLDHTKLARKSAAFLCDLDCLDTLVTDNAAPRELVEELRGKGLEVLVAGEEAAPASRAAEVGQATAPSPLAEATKPPAHEPVPAQPVAGGFAVEAGPNVSWD